MRTVILLLHRKVDAERKCICGSSMGYDDRTGWYCKRQRREDEPRRIDLMEVKK